jgi:hypothetical protein
MDTSSAPLLTEPQEINEETTPEDTMGPAQAQKKYKPLVAAFAVYSIVVGEYF